MVQKNQSGAKLGFCSMKHPRVLPLDMVLDMALEDTSFNGPVRNGYDLFQASGI